MSAMKDDFEFWSADRKLKYENAMAALLRKIEAIDVENAKNTGRHIIRHKEQRLKSTTSIIGKLNRKGKCIEKTDIEKCINDLAGVRVICFDVRQVYMLIEEIRKINEFEVLKEKDYILHPKDNGYQSYHMILRIEDTKVELQIRTILMDAWSSMETVLVYKKKELPPREILEKIHRFSKLSKKMEHMVEEILEEKNK